MTAGFRAVPDGGRDTGRASAHDAVALELARRDRWPVGRIVRQSILQCPGQTPVAAAARMMADAACSSIIVTERGAPAGIWTERDALALDLTDPATLALPVRDLMSAPIRTLHQDTTIEDAMPRFREARLRHFLVVDDSGAAVGVLSRTDVVRNSGLHGYLTLRTVGSVAKRRPLTVAATDTVAAVAAALRNSEAEAAVVLEADGKPYGIVTERDILRRVAGRDVARPVREIASAPILSIAEDAPLLHAQEMMEANRIRHLAVQSGDADILAVLSFTDILTGIEVDYLRHLQEAVSRQVQALEAGKARQDSILSLTQEGYAETDSHGRITDCNAAFEHLLGIGRTGLIGLPLPALAEGDAARKLEAGFAVVRGAEGAPHHTFETDLRHHGGGLRHVRISATVLRDDAGNTTGAFAFFSDLTELRAGEMRNRALVEQLRQSNEELEAFAYIVSHDLQEPLRMVASYLQLVDRRIGDALDPETREFMAFAAGGATRMQSMITDLLDYSRIDRKGHAFDDCDAALAVESAVRRLDATLSSVGARVTWDPLPTVKADFTQLVRLFQHLIDNAVKFRDPHRAPRVHISAERVTTDHGAGQETDGPACRLPAWRFSVRDNGIGIEPSFADRIFQMFQRLHARGAYGGNGIGLAICKRIVERHGGVIGVDSRLGEGSTFHVTLPDFPTQPEDTP
ncbi:CBS domain-containing protein [Caenispirillum salinarum]|uniref:CBS domain-containing protein n=1 Tax=Caenispirillum salinarum TaxID=859058 RepID=UPI00068F4F20|nr:CBS domain-containing protein [Caenispirillum salinarum]